MITLFSFTLCISNTIVKIFFKSDNLKLNNSKMVKKLLITNIYV